MTYCQCSPQAWPWNDEYIQRVLASPKPENYEMLRLDAKQELE